MTVPAISPGTFLAIVGRKIDQQGGPPPWGSLEEGLPYLANQLRKDLPGIRLDECMAHSVAFRLDQHVTWGRMKQVIREVLALRKKVDARLAAAPDIDAFTMPRAFMRAATSAELRLWQALEAERFVCNSRLLAAATAWSKEVIARGPTSDDAGFQPFLFWGIERCQGE